MSTVKKELKKMVILGQEILPGKGVQLNFDVAHLHTRTPILVPVIVERAKEDGPTVLVMAGLHGDEINGVEIIRRFIRKKLHKPTKGTIICLPVFNIFGIFYLFTFLMTIKCFKTNIDYYNSNNKLLL
jgi:predicted deacylase